MSYAIGPRQKAHPDEMSERKGKQIFQLQGLPLSGPIRQREVFYQITSKMKKMCRGSWTGFKIWTPVKGQTSQNGLSQYFFFAKLLRYTACFMYCLNFFIYYFQLCSLCVYFGVNAFFHIFCLLFIDV